MWFHFGQELGKLIVFFWSRCSVSNENFYYFQIQQSWTYYDYSIKKKKGSLCFRSHLPSFIRNKISKSTVDAHVYLILERFLKWLMALHRVFSVVGLVDINLILHTARITSTDDIDSEIPLACTKYTDFT